MNDYFSDNMGHLEQALRSIAPAEFERLLAECEWTLRNGNKVIVSGLGKNVPICDKFVGTMVSLGLDANFLHTNSAIHGDLGIVKDGDLVIVLTKSGSTRESIDLVRELKKRRIWLWLLTFSDAGVLYKESEKKLLIQLEHEGDMWNLVPINSSTLNLIILQTLAIELAKRFKVSRRVFQRNHPGGQIGEILRNEP